MFELRPFAKGHFHIEANPTVKGPTTLHNSELEKTKIDSDVVELMHKCVHFHRIKSTTYYSSGFRQKE